MTFFEWLLLLVILLGSLLVAWLLVERRLRDRELSEALQRLVGVLDRTISLAQSKGPLEFQAIQAMQFGYPGSQVVADYDPSDEAEARRLGEVEPTNPLEDALNANDTELGFLVDIDPRV